MDTIKGKSKEVEINHTIIMKLISHKQFNWTSAQYTTSKQVETNVPNSGKTNKMNMSKQVILNTLEDLKNYLSQDLVKCA